MRYLYGDSSEANLSTNYIEYLKDVLDLSVALLGAHQRLAQWRESQQERQAVADRDSEKLRTLGAGMESALTDLTLDVSDTSATGRAAGAIRQAMQAAVRKEIAVVDTGLQDDLRRISDHITQEGKGCYSALEQFLLHNDLPQAKRRINIHVGEKEYGTSRSVSALGVEWTVTLSVPPETMFCKPLRINDITQSLEIHAPEEKGLLLKKVKQVSQKLHKHYVAAIEITEAGTLLQLRAQPDPLDKGWDIDFNDDSVTVRRIGKDGSEGEPSEPTPEDSGKLRALLKELMAGVDELLLHRSALRHALLDGVSLAKHDNPGMLVKRVIGTMAPVVQEIIRRSPVDGELILKRVVDTDHREELLVRRAELEQKLARLSPAMRALFRPFGLATDVDDDEDVMEIDDDWLEEAEA